MPTITLEYDNVYIFISMKNTEIHRFSTSANTAEIVSQLNTILSKLGFKVEEYYLY